MSKLAPCPDCGSGLPQAACPCQQPFEESDLLLTAEALDDADPDKDAPYTLLEDDDA